jgi:hypothetical protein
MVIGESLLGQLGQILLERVFVFIVTRVFDKKLFPIVIKNLSGHFPRNSKTAVMFTLCLSYILFAGAMFAFQEKTITKSLEWTYGSDVVLYSENTKKPLPESQLRAYLEKLRISDNRNVSSASSIVEDFTFITFDISDYDHVQGTNIYGLASIGNPWVQLIGVETNFLNSTNKEFCIVSNVDPQYEAFLSKTNDPSDIFLGLGENLDPIYGIKYNQSALSGGLAVDNTSYVNATTIPIIYSAAVQKSLYINIDNLALINVKTILETSSTANTIYLTKPLASLRKLPAMPTFSTLVVSGSPVLVSMSSYLDILQDSEKLAKVSVQNLTKYTLPKQKLFIRVAPTATFLQIESLIYGVSGIAGSTDFKVQNLRQDLSVASQFANYLQLFFNAGNELI